MVIKGIKSRVVQIAVGILALSGTVAGCLAAVGTSEEAGGYTAAGTSEEAERYIAAAGTSEGAGGYTAADISEEAGAHTARKSLEVSDSCTAPEIAGKIAGSLRLVSWTVSASQEYGAVAPMLCPHRHESTVEGFFDTLNWYLDNTEESRDGDVAKAVRGLLNNSGELYFGHYREEEIRVFTSGVYDDLSRDEYWKYSFFLPDRLKPEACIYIGVGGGWGGYVYGVAENRFWSNDPQASQLPGFHSCVEEGKREIVLWLETAHPEGSCEIVYRGMERKDELEQYMDALHYSVSEKYADGREITWEAYRDSYLYSYRDYFFAETEQGQYEKRQLCTWESQEGDCWSFAFSKSFQIDGEGKWKSGSDWEVVALEDGGSKEPIAFTLDTEDYDWYGEMHVNDYNFDNIPDFARVWGIPANWGGSSTTVYIWDGKKGCHDAGTFLEVPGRVAATQTLYETIRGGYGYYITYAYRYREGKFVCIGSLEEEWLEDDSVIRTVRDEMGNEEVYGDDEELPDKWKELWGQ